MKQNKEQWWIDFFKGGFSEVVLNQQAHETLLFMQQVGELTESMNVFDQCCGKGYLAHEFDKAMMNVIGIDSSDDYIAYAKNELESGRANFLLGDANEFMKKTILMCASTGTPVLPIIHATRRMKECLFLSARI